MNQHELLAAVEDSWRQLDAAIDGLDEAAMVAPGVVGTWSVKDLLGHVTVWEQLALRHAEQGRRGEPPTGRGGLSIDDYNAAEAARRRDWPLARVQEESADTRRRLRATLQSLSDDEWTAAVGDGERRGPLGKWVGGALSGDTPGTHAAEHADQILAWRWGWKAQR